MSPTAGNDALAPDNPPMKGRRPSRRRGERTLLASVAISDSMRRMVKTLELAISKAAELPEAAQEQLGRELLERLDALAELHAELEAGIRELDAGLGEPLDIEDLIAQAQRE